MSSLAGLGRQRSCLAPKARKSKRRMSSFKGRKSKGKTIGHSTSPGEHKGALTSGVSADESDTENFTTAESFPLFPKLPRELQQPTLSHEPLLEYSMSPPILDIGPENLTLVMTGRGEKTTCLKLPSKTTTLNIS